MNAQSESKRRSWNGYGLSFWRCKCGAARRVTGCTVKQDCIDTIHADPCKRCGDTNEPAGWPSDPWLYFEESA